MSRFEELLPSQKSSTHNSIVWSPGERAGTGLLTIRTKRAYVNYLVVEFPTQFDGRAFHLAKTDAGTDTEETAYDVLVCRNTRDSSCSCKGFVAGNGQPCKHVLAISALLDNEIMWARCDLINGEQVVSNTEPPF